jgi:GlcNAc-P-P-Und epimerase
MSFENYFSPRKVTPHQMQEGAKPERVLVTGGSGFIGTNIVEFYRTIAGFEILSLDIKPPRHPAHTACYWRVDIRNFRKLDATVREFQPTVIYHLAARADLDGTSVNDYSASIVGVENLIHTILGLPSKPRNTIFASSRLVCASGYIPHDDEDYCPTTAYGASKVRTEQIVRKMAGSEFNWVIVRPTAIWGPWFEIPYRVFFDTIERGRYVHPKGRAIRKSFGFVGNSVYQLDRLAYGDPATLRHRTLYLCDYDPLDVYSWAVMIARSFNRREPLQVPFFTLRILAKIGDAIETVSRKRAPITSFRLNNLITETVHDSSPLRVVVGALPFTAEEGVAITTRWIHAERGVTA